TSSSEDEISSMCRENLKMIQNLVVQMVPIFGANPGVPEDLRTRSWRLNGTISGTRNPGVIGDRRSISRGCDHVRAWRSSIGLVKQKGNRAAEQPINSLFFLANHS
ncbi:hypothetical protein C2845_PM11G01810, partial [Panicum miliaceum]